MAFHKPSYGELERRVQDLEQQLIEKKDTENELRLFKAIINSSSEAIAVSNGEGRLVYINPAHEKLFGRTLAEAKKLNYRDYYPPESIEILNKVVAPALERGETWIGILDVLDANGRRFALWERADTVRNDQGRMAYGFGIMHDVSREVELEQELQEYKMAVEASEDLIAVVDRAFRYRMVNAAFLNKRGLERSQVIGRTAEQILGKEAFEEQVKPHLEKCFLGQEERYEMEYLYPKAGRRHLEVAYFPLGDAGHPVHRVVTVIRDVTERTKAAAAIRKAYQDLEEKVRVRTADLEKAKKLAEEAHKIKTDFLGNMSHEFRTPLNHIIGFVELMLDKSLGDLNKVQEEFLLDIHGSSMQLFYLVNSLLEVSKIGTRDTGLELTDFDLRGFLENSLALIKKGAATRKIQLSLTADAIPERIRGDLPKLKQALYPLLSNAMKFTPNGGRIHLSARRITEGPREEGTPEQDLPKEWIEISVMDNGIGMEPENLARVFDLFEQIEPPLTKKYQGVGLGLSLAKKFVELQGGRIWAESDGEGKGSTLRFRIPLRKP